LISSEKIIGVRCIELLVISVIGGGQKLRTLMLLAEMLALALVLSLSFGCVVALVGWG
jgi:hypothetical protein